MIDYNFTLGYCQNLHETS